ncbi:zinc finger protein RFP-like isoform X2 [Hemicordylus capensis]|uniref:zinc finger protein RFP-like isoform X2 n=1 Tax=Hemicordylus capensis TaxID=884348 RepID=UPI002304B76E|nr:zinc finger protein RFP-like isoform X2 [Hemicordylus capensis]
MAAGGALKDLCDEATCPICLEYFTDPVTIVECGHNFCRACLTQCWREAEASCPQCRGTVQQRNFIPNRQLANFVEIAKKLILQGGKRTGGEERVCEKHWEPLKLFCKDHEKAVCMGCERSKEHKNHKVIPLEAAFQEYKERTKAERQRTRAEFRQLHQFLEEQEQRLLAQMEEAEKEIAARRDEHLARLSGELSSLERLIQEMEKKYQQPVSELLQDIRSTWERCKAAEMFENPVAFPLELKWRIWDFCDLNPFLEGAMKQFKDTLVSGLQLQKANVTLDPDTAFPELILSGDRKSVRWDFGAQDLPDNPERFTFCPCVLGHEGFTAGRHCWEVRVGSVGYCGLGVARKSVRRKGSIDFDRKGGVWATWRWNPEYGDLSPPERLCLSGELKVRVSLNCAGQQLTFFNADTAALLCRFSGASFSGETLCPFFYLTGNARFRISP